MNRSRFFIDTYTVLKTVVFYAKSACPECKKNPAKKYLIKSFVLCQNVTMSD